MRYSRVSNFLRTAAEKQPGNRHFWNIAVSHCVTVCYKDLSKKPISWLMGILAKKCYNQENATFGISL